MKITSSKLVAARLAAAEVFIAEGLEGTNWGEHEDDADTLRRVAEAATFHVRWWVGKRGWIDVAIVDKRGDVSIAVEPQKLGRLSAHEAIGAAALLAKLADIARKVEAAIAEAAS